MTKRRLERLEVRVGVGRQAWAKNAAELEAACVRALELLRTDKVKARPRAEPEAACVRTLEWAGSGDSAAVRRIVASFRAAYRPDMDSDEVANQTLDALKAALSVDAYAVLIAVLLAG